MPFFEEHGIKAYQIFATRNFTIHGHKISQNELGGYVTELAMNAMDDTSWVSHGAIIVSCEKVEKSYISEESLVESNSTIINSLLRRVHTKESKIINSNIEDRSSFGDTSIRLDGSLIFGSNISAYNDPVNIYDSIIYKTISNHRFNIQQCIVMNCRVEYMKAVKSSIVDYTIHDSYIQNSVLLKNVSKVLYENKAQPTIVSSDVKQSFIRHSDIRFSEIIESWLERDKIQDSRIWLFLGYGSNIESSVLLGCLINTKKLGVEFNIQKSSLTGQEISGNVSGRRNYHVIGKWYESEISDIKSCEKITSVTLNGESIATYNKPASELYTDCMEEFLFIEESHEYHNSLIDALTQDTAWTMNNLEILDEISMFYFASFAYNPFAKHSRLPQTSDETDKITHHMSKYLIEEWYKSSDVDDASFTDVLFSGQVSRLSLRNLLSHTRDSHIENSENIQGVVPPKYTIDYSQSMITKDGVKLYRIRATENIPKYDVNVGDLGGWVESFTSADLDMTESVWYDLPVDERPVPRLSSDAWISNEAKVLGKAKVANSLICDDALVMSESFIMNGSVVGGKSIIAGESPLVSASKIYDAKIGGTSSVINSSLLGKVRAYGNTQIRDSLIEENSTYIDDKVIGKETKQ